MVGPQLVGARGFIVFDQFDGFRLAVLIDQENCLNFQGLRCDVCYRVCPLIDEAITLELAHNPARAERLEPVAGLYRIPGRGRLGRWRRGVLQA